jgi:transposase
VKTNTITAVGIDVSKGKSTVAVRRPGGEIVMTPFTVIHTTEGLNKLIDTLHSVDGEIRVVMEHTGMYWRPIALALKDAGFFVSVVNAMLIHDFSDNSIRKVKTDRADSLKIANYALTFWQELRDYSVEDENRQLLKIQSRLYERTLNSSVALRNGLISLLDQTFSGANKLFSIETRTASGHIKWVDFVRRFWHKDCVGLIPTFFCRHLPKMVQKNRLPFQPFGCRTDS